MKLNSTNFTEVEIEILTENISNLTFLDLSFSKMTNDQRTSLLYALKDSSNLQDLDLTGIDLSGVNIHLIKQSVYNVRKVSLEKNCLGKLGDICLLKLCKYQILILTEFWAGYNFRSNILGFGFGSFWFLVLYFLNLWFW